MHFFDILRIALYVFFVATVNRLWSTILELRRKTSAQMWIHRNSAVVNFVHTIETLCSVVT